MDQILEVAAAAARVFGRNHIDKSYGAEDFAQICALAIWQCKTLRDEEKENVRAYAFGVAKRRIFQENARIYALKRKSNLGLRFGAPGDIENPEITNGSIVGALADKKSFWLNDILVKDELEQILIGETYLPEEANIIESLLKGKSPNDISREFRMSSHRVHNYIKDTILRIRKRIGVEVEVEGYRITEIFRDRSSDEKFVDGWQEAECKEEKLLRGGLEGCGGINIDMDSYFAKKDKKDKEKKEAARIKREAFVKRFGLKNKLSKDKSPTNSKVHKSHRGSKKKSTAIASPEHIGEGAKTSYSQC